jgi:hypothetical protein
MRPVPTPPSPPDHATADGVAWVTLVGIVLLLLYVHFSAR